VLALAAVRLAVGVEIIADAEGALDPLDAAGQVGQFIASGIRHGGVSGTPVLESQTSKGVDRRGQCGAITPELGDDRKAYAKNGCADDRLERELQVGMAQSSR
jgi:hypothetical protein